MSKLKETMNEVIWKAASNDNIVLRRKDVIQMVITNLIGWATIVTVAYGTICWCIEKFIDYRTGKEGYKAGLKAREEKKSE